MSDHQFSANDCALEGKRCRELAVKPRLPSHALLLRAMAETWEGMAEDLRRLDNLALDKCNAR